MKGEISACFSVLNEFLFSSLSIARIDGWSGKVLDLKMPRYAQILERSAWIRYKSIKTILV